MLIAPLLLLCHIAVASLVISIPASPILPNPQMLPATTHATLTTLPSAGNVHVLTASLSHSSTLVFPELPAQQESYLLDIRSSEYAFIPYRVDVAADGSILGVWETFRGNPWDNRGVEKYVVDDSRQSPDSVVIEARAVGRRGFYEERAKFSPLSLVKNPMILMAIVALGFTFGMPKLMENMDPEMRAEFEQQSRASPMNAATSNAMTGGGFDLAGWMAGTSPGPMASTDSASGGTTGRESSNAARLRG
ncbi:hypothetical protein N7468_003320 [Penicillium chermesinum]|uniref:ER membrane protein complex subunit 7 beta-sandwich domain-containing protein n=1 Tax=Penicillium chermesinum TaxID=63820 RepID=A0A9W9TRH0_9EURO|nr:uncharacterized protein N7468_003320 [Penicillium chermesinum]KAJ5238701.1 hypothetical protein N7468_003320 [Penicillium chermesinum]KAJ6164345.1 hypothetical protein N7470_003017 [Penicillium chermesinum]